MTKTGSLRAVAFMLFLTGSFYLNAQNPESELPPALEQNVPLPLDDIAERDIIAEGTALRHAPVRESDIMWEKTVWAVIDTREKLNLPFRYPEAPFFKILLDAALSGELPVYEAENGHLVRAIEPEAIRRKVTTYDTLLVYEPETFDERVDVVQNDLDWESVKRFRIKETWYIDSRTGSLNVRVLGIAPLLEKYTDDGTYIGEQVLFWVHVPSARGFLSGYEVFTPQGNTSTTISWADWLDMRHFSSTIIKEKNVYDRRLQDYLAGEDLLMEAARIKAGIFNKEQDLWSK